jgi:hypothetical protein
MYRGHRNDNNNNNNNNNNNRFLTSGVLFLSQTSLGGIFGLHSGTETPFFQMFPSPLSTLKHQRSVLIHSFVSGAKFLALDTSGK